MNETTELATFKLKRDPHFPWIGWLWSVTLPPVEVNGRPITFSGWCWLKSSAERHIYFTLGWGRA